jgi:hypothetical protein
MSKQEKIIYLKETTVGSIVSDIVTFGTIVGSFWFNYKFINGNNWLDVLLFISFFLFAVGKTGNYRKLAELNRGSGAEATAATTKGDAV